MGIIRDLSQTEGRARNERRASACGDGVDLVADVGVDDAGGGPRAWRGLAGRWVSAHGVLPAWDEVLGNVPPPPSWLLQRSLDAAPGGQVHGGTVVVPGWILSGAEQQAVEEAIGVFLRARVLPVSDRRILLFRVTGQISSPMWAMAAPGATRGSRVSSERRGIRIVLLLVKEQGWHAAPKNGIRPLTHPAPASPPPRSPRLSIT